MIPRCQPGVDCRPLGRSKFTRPGYGNRALLVARSIEPASANRRDWRIGLLLATPAIHRRTSSFDGDTTVGVFPGGIVDYSNGDACLRYSGLPGTRFHNLDPELRCGRSTYGCIVTGNEWVTQSPYNCALRLATACFGWMPNTYDGPYPTETEAVNAIADSFSVPVRDLQNDRLVIEGSTLQLDEGSERN